MKLEKKLLPEQKTEKRQEQNLQSIKNFHQLKDDETNQQVSYLIQLVTEFMHLLGAECKNKSANSIANSAKTAKNEETV